MTHGMIVAPQPEAVEAGALCFRRGGNAVDAAITCALVETVVVVKFTLLEKKVILIVLALFKLAKFLRLQLQKKTKLILQLLVQMVKTRHKLFQLV